MYLEPWYTVFSWSASIQATKLEPKFLEFRDLQYKLYCHACTTNVTYRMPEQR